MKIKEYEKEGIVVLEVEEKMLLGDGDLALMRVVNGYIEKKKINIILHLKTLGTSMDSGGLGELVRTYTKLQNVGGEFKIVTENKSFLDLLAVTKLISVFEIFDNIDKAIESYAK